MVLSVEAKQTDPNKWEVYTDNGRERSGLDVIDWIKKGVGLGAGEILLTSVDREGTRKGFDIPLLQAVTQEISVPVIASGGMGKPEDMIDAVLQGGTDAIAMADILHYDRATLGDIRSAASIASIEVRDFKYA
jgi:cyclase